jgi:hypothetical protein
MMDQEFSPWRKSTRSDGGQDCVEVSAARDGSAIRVRDSKNRSGPVLSFRGSQWRAFVLRATEGDFDPA